jgi:ketosteroid isomerase-like protein
MRSFVDALGAHDEVALLELVHRDAQFESLIAELEGKFYGHDGVRAYLASLFASFPDFRVGVDEIREHADATVIKVRVRATGISGGVPLDFTDWLAMRSRDGKADWWAFFRSEAEALGAARTPGALTGENVRFVQSIYAAWEKGDFRSVDWADPQIEWERPDGPEPGRWNLDDVATGWRALLSAWEGFRITAEEFRELDSERVLVLTSYTGKGRTSGIDVGAVGAKGASLFHIRNGKVARQVYYWDRQRALDDLGLASKGAAS